MPPDPRHCLEDMRKAAARIQTFAGGHDFAHYAGDELLRAGVERQFITIGEALNQLATVAPQLAGSITNHGRIIAFRNILVHGYSVIDDQIVWDAVQHHLPTLAQEVDARLAQLNQP